MFRVSGSCNFPILCAHFLHFLFVARIALFMYDAKFFLKLLRSNIPQQRKSQITKLYKVLPGNIIFMTSTTDLTERVAILCYQQLSYDRYYKG